MMDDSAAAWDISTTSAHGRALKRARLELEELDELNFNHIGSR